MTDKKEKLFNAGEFARLHHLSRRTLVWYDEIGLFSPICRQENQYRGYSLVQSPTLEMILSLRELDVPIEQIRHFLDHRQSELLYQLFDQQLSEVRRKQNLLKEIELQLQRQKQVLTEAASLIPGSIDIVEKSEEWLSLSSPISSDATDEDWLNLLKEAESPGRHRLYNTDYGSMICTDKLKAGNFLDYDYLFVKLRKTEKPKCLHRKPGGLMLRAVCQGAWEQLPQVYMNCLEFAQRRELQLTGFAYETGINELAISSMDEYLTVIEIPVMPARSEETIVQQTVHPSAANPERTSS